jgi:hypothetical protein
MLEMVHVGTKPCALLPVLSAQSYAHCAKGMRIGVGDVGNTSATTTAVLSRLIALTAPLLPTVLR